MTWFLTAHRFLWNTYFDTKPLKNIIVPFNTRILKHSDKKLVHCIVLSKIDLKISLRNQVLGHFVSKWTKTTILKETKTLIMEQIINQIQLLRCHMTRIEWDYIWYSVTVCMKKALLWNGGQLKKRLLLPVLYSTLDS